MQPTLNCAIIGAGSIGGLIDSPSSKNIASHAHAYEKNPTCKLIAVCDTNDENKKSFQKKWGNINTYSDTKKMFEKEQIDVLSIASPTSLHVKHLKEALHVKEISHIPCKNPLSSSIKKLKEIETLLQSSDKKILINLIRRYIPSFLELAKDIDEKRWGKPLHFNATFTKGLLHNGSHVIALLQHLFKEVSTITPLYISAFSNGDICGNFELTCKEVKGLLTCLDGLDYSFFELTIVFKEGVIYVKEGGDKLEIYEKEPSQMFEGYNSLKLKCEKQGILKRYASDSLGFLLEEGFSTCKEILNEHLHVHKIILETIEKTETKCN